MGFLVHTHTDTHLYTHTHALAQHISKCISNLCLPSSLPSRPLRPLFLKIAATAAAHPSRSTTPRTAPRTTYARTGRRAGSKYPTTARGRSASGPATLPNPFLITAVTAAASPSRFPTPGTAPRIIHVQKDRRAASKYPTIARGRSASGPARCRARLLERSAALNGYLAIGRQLRRA